MRLRVFGQLGRVFARVAAGIVVVGAAAAASAQTTVTLNQPATQVVSATVRSISRMNRSGSPSCRTASTPKFE